MLPFLCYIIEMNTYYMSLRENTSDSLVSLHFIIPPIGLYIKTKHKWQAVLPFVFY
ncbi:hypothetical protein ACUXP3_001037 [Bacillus altitudinis]